MKTQMMIATWLSVSLAGGTAATAVVDFASDRWVMKDAQIVQHLNRTSLSGTAYLNDVEFDDGVIEVDIAVDGRRSYPGIVFRMQSEEDHERFYIRPHRSGLYPDVLQYTPVFNRVACWQLFHGEGFTALATIPRNEWIHLKMEIRGTQARVYLNDAPDPALVIHELKHGLSKGSIGVMGPRDGSAYFSNFSYRPTGDVAFEDPPKTETPSGTITQWELSRPFKAAEIDRQSYPGFFAIYRSQWHTVDTEPSGLLNISKHAKRSPPGPDCVFARTTLRSTKQRDAQLSLGYSDDVSVFLNGKIVFSGQSGYRSRDPSYVGVVGLNDTLHLTLQKGLNEIFLIVTESFGGWGIMGKMNRRIQLPLKQHDLLVKAWETPDVFKIPESVVYDSARDILYVSSYDKIEPGHFETGFISRVQLDGQIKDLQWVTGLDGPCGMAIHGNNLFVVEAPRRNLVKIDIESGAILERYPIPETRFLNDVAADQSGNIYVTNTTRESEQSDIYKCREGKCEVWKDGHELHAANGLFIHDNELIVGSSGNGSLKAVSLADGRTRSIVSLGAGVIDGIRVNDQGNYLISHWEGKAYIVTPSGEVTEILDERNAGLNLADFEFVKEQNLLIIPTFLGNRVCAYRLTAG